MKNARILVLEDNKELQDLLNLVVGQKYQHTTLTAEPEQALDTIAHCYILDHDLGCHQTGHHVACGLRALYGSGVFLISHTSGLPEDANPDVYDAHVQKGTGISRLYLALEEFDDWYRVRANGEK